ncbi:twin-arginine translocation pathway signal protein [Limnohabitans sp. 2KL-17]|uniref:Acg family FMN-binding oxidoreductase n=1 Tax=Limnohabitans sp. 2KL-17 TaxID=1100704 RepID=UPI000D38AD4A|nr:nitroreductase family protein [Limnohabitans sp. 2KL-17]PUE63186.1 twin-arginine translocation pathway signal protein [Limnohabitans sp. 2KL-17]
MNRRQILRIAGGGFIAAATASTFTGCSADMPPEAIAAWLPPADTLDIRRWVISHALLAPHAHNLQSWLVDLATPDTIVLRMDMKRLLPETDPLSRQLVISQGTFIELLDLAARQRGYRTEVKIFPEGEFDDKTPDARPTASVRLVLDAQVKPDPLFAQIFRRHTNRAAYETRAPDAAALQALTESVAGLPVTSGWVTLADDVAMKRHAQIAMDAWRTELVTPRTLLESYKVLRIGPKEIVQHRDGVSLNSPMLRAIAALGLFDRTQASAADSSEIKDQVAQFNAKIATTPAYFWLNTKRNDRTTQLLAGRAYVRAQLAATAHGLSMHPLSQALQEYTEQAPHYQAIHQLLGATEPGHTVQMWTRLGYGPSLSPSPRRGLDAHLPRT